MQSISRAAVKDATVVDEESIRKADIVLADVPCSGLGVIGKKQDIKYKMSAQRQQDIIRLRRRILSVVQDYVKPGGVLIYSTCTIGADENQYNLKWFLENYPFRLESIDHYICDALKSKTTKGGYIRLLPGIHESDGFFIARLRRLEETEEVQGEGIWRRRISNRWIMRNCSSSWLLLVKNRFGQSSSMSGCMKNWLPTWMR
ncbi:MAG: hypothetical protein ACLTSZ_08805 [Lachnospiraceae bacterium]